jgi:hydroxymethylpyrimidine pyrophosphatase-like HAD family hydrolase
MKILDIRFPSICENGTVIYDLTHNHSRYTPGLTQEKLVGLRAVRSFIETEVLPKYETALLQFGKEAQLSVFSKTPKIFGEIKPMIEQFVRDHRGPDLVVNASHYYLNISLKGLDKGSAIRHLMDELGLKREEVAGIGDTEGDLPLRNQVGFFACPSNSTPEVKKVADYVSPHANIAGVLDILSQPAMRLNAK